MSAPEAQAETLSSSPPTVQDAVFPRDVPLSGEDKFLSIYGHAGGWKWAMHENAHHSYAPTMFWFTPGPTQDDLDQKEPCRAIHQFLTPRVLDYVFGTTKVHTNMKKSATDQAKKRKVPAMTIYILAPPASPPAVAAADPSASTSTNAVPPVDMARDIAILFKDIPVRLLRILPEQFFPPDQHVGGVMQPIMTADRLAALYYAKTNYNSSRGILIIHGGEVLAYSAMDQQGKIVGGGVSPGLSMRFRAIFDYSPEEDFPNINWPNLKEKLKQHAHNEDRGKVKKAFVELFSVDIEDGVVAGVISEVAGHIRNVVKQFLQLVSPAVEAADTSVEPPRTPATVLLEGTDNDFLHDLLSDNASDICSLEPGVEMPKKTEVDYCCRKNLTAYGIQKLLVVSSRQQVAFDPDEDIRGQIIGLRGAFMYTDTAGKTTQPKPRRGTFVNTRRGRSFEDDMFEVLYDDDGEKDFVDVTGLYDSIRLYLEIGEDGSDVNTREWVATKTNDAANVGKILVETNDNVRQRKAELDQAKAEEGSVAGLLAKPEKTFETIMATASKKEKKKTDGKRGRKVEMPSHWDPKDFLGRRIAKYFEKVLYFGTVDHITNEEVAGEEEWWHILYDDGDEEDLDYLQLKEALILYEEHYKEDPNPDPSSLSKKKRARK